MFGVICYGSLITGHSFIRKFQRNREAKRKSSLVEGDSQQMKAIGIVKDTSGDIDESQMNGTGSEPNDNNPVTTPDSGLGEIKHTIWTQKLLKKLHGAFMIISLIMVTGAGAAFTRRFASTDSCKNIYCDGDAEGPLPICWIE